MNEPSKPLKPLLQTISFWGYSISVILLMFLSAYTGSSSELSTRIGTIGMSALFLIVGFAVLATTTLVFTILVTIHLTKASGRAILARNTISKSILYTFLAFVLFLLLSTLVIVIVGLGDYFLGNLLFGDPEPLLKVLE